MIRVTERAKEVLLQRKRSARIDDPEMGLRLAATRSGNLVLVTDRVKAGDQVIRCQDSMVLLVQPELSEFVLARATVDCLAGRDLVVRQTKGRGPGP